jgi:hypothetical protein
MLGGLYRGFGHHQLGQAIRGRRASRPLGRLVLTVDSYLSDNISARGSNSRCGSGGRVSDGSAWPVIGGFIVRTQLCRQLVGTAPQLPAQLLRGKPDRRRQRD